MDMVPEWAAQFLGEHQQTLQTYGPYARQAYSYISTAKSYLFPLIDQISRKPDLATIALLLVVILISLKLLDMLWQTLLFWLRLARRVAFWGTLVVLAIWMYSRGPDGVWQDVEYWYNVWNQEHDYWKDRERVARLAQGRGRATKGGWF